MPTTPPARPPLKLSRRALLLLSLAPLRAFAGGAPVLAVAFSPDGRRLAAGVGARVAVWDPADGKLLQALEGHPEAVHSLAFRPDGRFLAAGGRGEVRLWEATEGGFRPGSVLAPPRERPLDRVTALAFSHAQGAPGALLAAGGGPATRGGELLLWALEPAPVLAATPPNAHSDTVYGLAFLPGGARLLSGGADRSGRLWQVERVPAPRLHTPRTLQGHTHFVYGVAARPDGKQVATAGGDGAVKLWDPETAEVSRSIAAHTGAVHAVAYTPDGRLLASGGEDGRVKLWNPATGAPYGPEVLPTPGAPWARHPVTSLAFSPDGKLLAAGTWDGAVRLFRTADARPAGVLADP